MQRSGMYQIPYPNTPIALLSLSLENQDEMRRTHEGTNIPQAAPDIALDIRAEENELPKIIMIGEIAAIEREKSKVLPPPNLSPRRPPGI